MYCGAPQSGRAIPNSREQPGSATANRCFFGRNAAGLKGFCGADEIDG
jgi:hypothetical protein